MTLAQVWAVDTFLATHADAKEIDVSFSPRSPLYGAVAYEIPCENDGMAPVAFTIDRKGRVERYF